MLSIDCLAQQRNPNPTLDQLRAKNFTVVDIQGKRLALNRLIGQGKPVVIDIWATWCGPCRLEIPHLLELYRQYKHDGLVVIGITVEDPVEDRNAVKSFVREFKMDYSVAFSPKDIYVFFNGNVPNYRIPQTIVFNAEGKLIKRLIGYNPGLGKQILNDAVAEAVGRK